jgi:hypothetical protein
MAQGALKRAARGPSKRKERDLQEANAAVYYKAFRSLAPESRRRLALRILQDEGLLEELYDHFLIQQAERERGRNVPWEEYVEGAGL